MKETFTLDWYQYSGLGPYGGKRFGISRNEKESVLEPSTLGGKSILT